ncbi:M20/M25/M40 family metallo-hydrolase [Carboxylicivirga sp. N1Y90]|uniref:M20/M25/M40 family metallo-hydrolase n=1 Tax=Carboxylicivirga fragile TaxID=3417571 RepID=UPI003D3310BD|nr:M20/M25/M40 family metallo-hydrolase [Marinilabiliaceae bacterium N1Y90]
MKRISLTLFGLLLILQVTSSQSETDKGLQAINKDVLKGQLDFLASDWMEGRNTAEKGAYMAADYIASMFRVYGLKPGGDMQWIRPSREERSEGKKSYEEQTYFQNFPLIQYTEGEEQSFSIIEKSKHGEKRFQLNYKTDYSLYVSSHGIECTAPLVFVGYGLSDKENGYDDYKGLDVEGKIIVRLNGLPGYKDKTSEAYKKLIPKDRYAKWAIYDKKDDLAAEKGAIAIIEITPGEDNSLNWAMNTPFHVRSENYQGPKQNKPYVRLRAPGKNLGKNLTTIRLTSRAVNKLFEGFDFDLEDYEKKAARLINQKNFSLNKSVHLKTTVESKIVKARNVIGVIEGENTDEYIVVGAHYDHLGIKNGFIYNGADDNGSGTVGIMSIAKAVMATGKKPEKTIIFAAWTGEEKGLIGSRHYCENPTVPLEQIKYYANYDMISRNVKDTAGVKCFYSYTKSSEVLKTISDDNIKAHKLKLELNYRAMERPAGGSDHVSFAKKSIPVTCMITGLHNEYHTPKDVIGKVNYDKMLEIVKLGFLNIWQLSNDPELLKKN